MSKVWKGIFAIIMALGIYATVIRFAQGLGPATNLSDQFPWGLWIGFDILVGVGLAAGGFVIAATVHIFHLEKYEDIARPTILTAFLGYVLVVVALLIDIGRPYRIWHPMVMGNPHSVMFEVAMCVMFYTTVLALEFSPLVLKRFNLKKPLKIIHAIYTPLVVVGVLLSTLHQSSLGTVYVIVPDKLYGLWYTPLLPVFFFLSAIAGGLAMTIFESFMSWRAFGRRLEHELLEGIARTIVVVLAVLFVWKFMDLNSRGELPLMFELTQESVMFWGEMGLGVVLPMVLFLMPRIRASEGGLFFGAMLTIMGFIINRLNVAITGMARASGVNYMPSWMEFAITAAIVAAGFYLFGLAVKYLEVFPEEKPAPLLMPAAPTPPRTKPVFQGRLLLGLWGFLLIGFMIFGFSNKMKNGKSAEAATGDTETIPNVAYREALRIGDIRMPLGEDSPGVVVFSHETHVDPREPSCETCHTGDFALVPEGPKNAAAYLMDTMYEGKSCGKCHNGEDAFASDGDCETCHQSE
jgi:c(7)-type cytochrome triheme protein